MTGIERAYIMAAGAGKRMARDMGSKPMTPVGGKFLIEYGLDALRAFGVADINVVYSDSSEDVLTLKSRFPEVSFLRQQNVCGSLSTLGFIAETAKTPFLLMDADIIVSKENFSKMLRGVPDASPVDAWFAAVRDPVFPNTKCLRVEGGTVREFNKKGFETDDGCFQGGMIYLWLNFPYADVKKKLDADQTGMAGFLADAVRTYRIGAMFIDTVWDVDTPEEADAAEKLLTEAAASRPVSDDLF